MENRRIILKGNDNQRLIGIGFILASVLMVVGNIWVTWAGLGNPGEFLNKISGSPQIRLLQIVALLLTFGFWAAMIGAVGIYRSTIARGAIWVRLGFYFMVIGTTLWTLGMSLDITYSNLIANWLAASGADKEFARTLITIYAPTIGIGRSNFPMVVMSAWLAIGLLNIGMVRSSIYPRWLGWFGLVVGVIGFIIGIIMVFTGREALFNYFTVIAFVTILWFLVTGIWSARNAW